MKYLVIVMILMCSFKSNGQSWKVPQYVYSGSWEPPIPTKTFQRTVIDRFELLSIKYDIKEVIKLDSISRKDTTLRYSTSYRLVFEMPGLHLQQRLKSDTLEITNFESVRYIKVNGRVYNITSFQSQKGMTLY